MRYEAYTLCVESGPHAGAVQRLAPGLYTIGSDTPAAIILQDAELVPLHLLLELGETDVRLEALNGEFSIENDRLVTLGQERRLPPPVVFTVGATRISLRAPVEAPPTGFARFRVAALLAVPLVAGLAYVAFALFQTEPNDREVWLAKVSGVVAAAGPNQPKAETNPAGTAAATAMPAVQSTAVPAPNASTHVQPAPPTPEQAHQALRQRLADAKLDQLELTPDNQSLVLRGSIDPAAMAKWRAIQSWYDTQFGQGVPLVAQIQVASPQAAPKLMIESIWTGEQPYLIAGNGERYSVGATIADGWTIENIERDRIVLRRGPTRFELTL